MLAICRNEASADGIVRTLHPGDVICAERNVRLETLLGSCIAIVLTDRNRTIGAMCHIVHCRPAQTSDKNPCAYGDAALAALYGLIRQYGFNPQMCDAFIYGGGNMFPQLITQGHVGQDNAQWVLEQLQRDGVRVLFSDVGGNGYRRLSWTIGPDDPQVVTISV